MIAKSRWKNEEGNSARAYIELPFYWRREKRNLDCGNFPIFFFAETQQTYRPAGLMLGAGGGKMHTRRLPAAPRFSEFSLINYPLSENGRIVCYKMMEGRGKKR